MEAAKAIRRTMESNEKAAMVIDHDIYFIDIVSDSLLVFNGLVAHMVMQKGLCLPEKE